MFAKLETSDSDGIDVAVVRLYLVSSVCCLIVFSLRLYLVGGVYYSLINFCVGWLG